MVEEPVDDLLTAPTAWSRRGWSCPALATHRRRLASRDRRRAAAAVAPPHEREGAEMEANDRAENHEPRNMTALVVPAVGVVGTLSELPRVGGIDAAGEPVLVISAFLNTLLASGASPGSVRSYALALLRWWQFLAAVFVPWDRATRVEVRDFVLWMRFTANPTISARSSLSGGVNPGGYAPPTINHNLAVLRSFSTDRIDAGLGPLVNPVPAALGRGGQRLDAHHNPMLPYERHRRAAAPEAADPTTAEPAGPHVERAVRRVGQRPGPGAGRLLRQHRRARQ